MRENLIMLVDKDLIILADDDKYSVDFFKSAVKNMCREFHLVTCENGEELVKYLSNPNNVRPAMVFLAINMPISPGLKILERLRTKFPSEELSIAVYSSHANKALKVATSNLGADYCIAKPTSSIILQNLIEQLARQVETKIC